MIEILAAGGSESHGAIMSLWSGAAVIALITLTILEIVLGIDNIIFISILSDKLPQHQQAKARTLGLSLAMVMRVGLLLSISWIMGLVTPVFGIGDKLGFILADDQAFSYRDLILLVGGVFLIYKSVTEIHEKLEGDEHAHEGKVGISFASVIVQILFLDIIFSLDSVITAVGMVQNPAGDQTAQLIIMVTAVVIAVGVMLFAAGPISDFVNAHPTLKMLAFSFLILVGVVLIADATHRHIPKGYIYFAMAFSVGVEMLNLKLRARGKTVLLNSPKMPDKTGEQHATTD